MKENDLISTSLEFGVLHKAMAQIALQTGDLALIKKGLSSLFEPKSLCAGSNLPCSNQNINGNPKELKEVEIQRFLADLRATSHFCKVFRVGQNKDY